MALQNLEKITKKFYKNEQERQQKLETFKIETTHILAGIGDFIKSTLKEKGISFFLFDIDLENNLIHAGLCNCNKKEVPENLRKEFEYKIKQNTIFERIEWHL